MLTKKIADTGREVMAVDSSAAFVESERKLGLVAHVIDAVALPYREEFDAVFSNAMLHWIKRAEEMIAFSGRLVWPGSRRISSGSALGSEAAPGEAGRRIDCRLCPSPICGNNDYLRMNRDERAG